MIGIYLLFFVSLLFVGNKISHQTFDFKLNYIITNKSTKYIFAILVTIFCAIPIFYVLWDYYSLVNLFYSLFGGISIFCALLMLRFVASCIICDFSKNLWWLPLKSFLQTSTKPYVFLVIFAFSLVLFLGHLDLITLDIFTSNKIICAIFVGVYIITLYFVDKTTGFLALFAFIIASTSTNDLAQNSTYSVFFALFDGYLLIYSFAISLIWGLDKILAKN